MPLFGREYDNLNDAAAAALWLLEHQPRVNEMEYKTLLFRNKETGKIQRGDFQTQGKTGGVEWRGYIPSGYEIAGDVHNHPDLRDRDTELYSETDIGTAKGLGVPAYLAAIRGDRVADQRRWTPGDPTKMEGGGFERQRVGIGSEFLAQFPIDEMRTYLMRKLLDRAPDDPRGLMR